MNKNDNENRNSHGGGITFFGALTVAFIALKLAGVINWPWIWVLSPLWIPVVLLGIILLIVIVVVKTHDEYMNYKVKKVAREFEKEWKDGRTD